MCCNLYSARLQFYLLHVFVANRAHTVYVKPRCWHVHATFPFQNRFWRRAPRRLSQRRRRFSRQGCTYSAVRHSSSFESFFFFIYPSLSLACIRIEVSNVRYSNYHRCSVVLGFVIIVNRCVLLIIEKCCVTFPFSIVHKSEARVMAIRLNKWRIFIMEENCTRHRYRKATDKSAARSHKYSLVKRINTSNEP